MRVYVESQLACHADSAWREVLKSALLLEIVRPLVRIVPADAAPFPERWTEGKMLFCRSYLFGWIPMGARTLTFLRIDPASREIETREHDPLIRRWDHVIRIRPMRDGRTRYSDKIEIDAGPLTLVVWLFARWFYRHRQRRWRRVAKRLRTQEHAAARVAVAHAR